MDNNYTGPSLGNIPLSQDQFAQLSTLKTLADRGVPDEVLMPYFEQVMGSSFMGPQDKLANDYKQQAQLLEIYKARQELGLDNSQLDQLLGSQGNGGVQFDMSELEGLDQLKKQISNQKLLGRTVDPMYERLVEFADYAPTQGEQMELSFSNILNPEMWFKNPREVLGRRKFGSEYDSLQQTKDYLGL